MSCSTCLLWDILFALVALLIVFYAYAKFKFNYWSKKGVETKWNTPQFPFGNFNEVVFRKENFSVMLRRLQDTIKGPFGGVYLFLRPVFMVKDPELIRQILVKDFDIFPNRGFYHYPEYEPLTNNMLAAVGDKWQLMRNKFLTFFSGRKLEELMPLFLKINSRVQNYLDTAIESKENIIEMRDMMARYSTDFIASAGFNLNVDSINDKDTEFRYIGRRIIFPRRQELIRFFLGFMIPATMKLFKLPTTVGEIQNFFQTKLEKTMNERKEMKVSDDLMQHFIELIEGGNFNEYNVWDPSITDGSARNLTTNDMLAQMFLFFFGGHDASSSTMSFGFFELAKNQALQKKVQQHIDEVLVKYDNEWTYDCIQDMKYLDQVVDETLRMYPSVPFLMRKNVKDYQIPNSNVTLDKGTLVAVSLLSLHRDEEHYPNPSVFDPERFSPENRSAQKHFTYLPFGEGPRQCMGLRFGRLQTKMGMAAILSKYNLELANGRSDEISFNVDIVQIADVDGIKLKISSRR